uniref:Uncharacterized protein n=1 Tax=Siphoviridae sp. ctcfw7 TaxID=2826394 RepID=A0A8S5MH75_9CAUD|nr:MAG TPA: hypothetical protein [Siphoviridae sp. ctcfw7]
MRILCLTVDCNIIGNFLADIGSYFKSALLS